MIKQFLRLSAAVILGLVISSAWGCTPAETPDTGSSENGQQADDDHDHDGDDHGHDHD